MRSTSANQRRNLFLFAPSGTGISRAILEPTSAVASRQRSRGFPARALHECCELRKQDRRAKVAPQFAEQALHAAAGARIKRAECFVHQENTQLRDQCLRNCDALLHAA